MKVKVKDTLIINDKEYIVVNVKKTYVGAVNFADNSEIVLRLRPFQTEAIPEKQNNSIVNVS